MSSTDIDASSALSGAPLESVLCTEELDRRPARQPDYQTENRALVSLAKALADSSATILQTLAETILQALQCGSAGVSLLSEDGKRFYWPSVVGAWKEYIGGGTPRDFSPCGDVLDRNRPLMMKHVERRYPYFGLVMPAVEECLLVPFYLQGKAVGTIWAVIHDPKSPKFDREDLRILESLATFASSAYRAVESNSKQAQQTDELRAMNESLLVSSVRQHELTEQAEKDKQTISDNVRRFRGMFDALPAAIYTTDAQGKLTYFNPACIEFSGRTPQLGSDHWCVTWKLYNPDGTPMPHDGCPMAVALKTGRVIRGAEAIAERPDGSRIWFTPYPTPLFDSARNIVGGINMLVDITERKAAEERLREAMRQAEAANDAKDRFMAVLSHELRTPLTPVMLAVAAREMDADLPLALREDLRMIRRNVELEVKLIDDLLDLNRIISGKLRLQSETLDVNDLVRHVCDMCRSNIREKGVRLHCTLDGEVGEVVGDAGRLQQIIWNLLNNAAKFTPKGGDIHVSTANTEGSKQVRVTVRDTGIGISPEALPRIFDAFEQGDASITRRFGGMGLGLAISKLLVEQHRGSIRAESGGANHGSTFVIDLPAQTRRQAPVEAPAKGITNRGGGGAPLRVLLVEDHTDTANVLRRLLTVSGLAVMTANTAADALSLAKEHTFDVIVSDLGLPDMTGYEMMTQIRLHYGTPGIAMSGYGMEEDIKKSRQAGFSDHIVKPVSMVQLEQCIRRAAMEAPSGAQ